MKNKTSFIFMIGLTIFILMLLFLEFNYVESIDIYGKNIQDMFNFSSVEKILLFITNMMSVLGIGIILGLVIYFFRKRNLKRELFIYIGSIIGCLGLTNLIKIIVKRERPLEQLLSVNGFSFPSSHSSVSMVVYGFIILLINRYYTGKYKNIYILLCVLLILLTGISRIYFNVHYITDVIAGYGVGLIILCISSFIMKKLTK